MNLKTKSPQAHEYTQPEIIELAERQAQSMLGVSWGDAVVQLASGSLAGTAAEAELRMLQFLLAGSSDIEHVGLD